MNIYLLSPYGFCIGVKNAINIAKETLNYAKEHNKNVYFEHALIHNDNVILELNKIKTYKLYNNETLSDNDIFLISAHGHDFSIDNKIKNAEIRSAFCFLLENRFKLIDKSINEKKELLYLGEKKHQETISTLSYIQIKNNYQVKYFSSKQEVIDYLSKNEIVERVLIVQSTFQDNVDFKFKNLTIIKPCEYCYLRKEKLKKNLSKFNTYVVVGSNTSSNTKALYNMAKTECENTYLINDISQLSNVKLAEPIFLCSGTSANNELVEQIYNYIKEL